ncbi:TPA: hypothetical protein TXT54_001963 [Streptococcus suis]|nr:hypothetical protein [Streptococcus suis]
MVLTKRKAPRTAIQLGTSQNYLPKLYHGMKELDSTQQLLVSNWKRKYYQLSEVLINSLVGLTVVDTLEILAKARKDKAWLNNITP